MDNISTIVVNFKRPAAPAVAVAAVDAEDDHATVDADAVDEPQSGDDGSDGAGDVQADPE